MRKIIFWLGSLVIAPIILMAGWSVAMGWPDNWHTADWSSAGLAPDPAKEKAAIIQVYAARAGRWKGIFSVHSWIVLKPENAPRFTRFEVVGWGNPLRVNSQPVDGLWYGNRPEVILEIRGEAAQSLIGKIVRAVQNYPYSQRGGYRAWPGPNSNTFVAWIGRQVPEMNLEMPATAVGKDYLGEGVRLSTTPSGTGWQVSLWGLIGVAVALREGIELHFLGTTIGVDFDDLSIKLPGIGTLGLG